MQTYNLSTQTADRMVRLEKQDRRRFVNGLDSCIDMMNCTSIYDICFNGELRLLDYSWACVRLENESLVCMTAQHISGVCEAPGQ